MKKATLDAHQKQQRNKKSIRETEAVYREISGAARDLKKLQTSFLTIAKKARLQQKVRERITIDPYA
ncbi:hypothetical protein HY622_03270 [Candidatus Uhrbacteria bacterium]|nr:hypothetical protein [Candidatus Uhrbacteria bacterium]